MVNEYLSHRRDLFILWCTRFKLTYEEEHYNYSLEPTVEYWLQNLDKLDSIERTKHIQLLELSARYLKQNKDQILRDIGLATLVFER